MGSDFSGRVYSSFALSVSRRLPTGGKLRETILKNFIPCTQLFVKKKSFIVCIYLGKTTTFLYLFQNVPLLPLGLDDLPLPLLPLRLQPGQLGLLAVADVSELLLLAENSLDENSRRCLFGTQFLF